MAERNPVTFTLEGEPRYHLLGTYTRYSSWTARVEVLLEYFQIPYKATIIKLDDVKRYSKSGYVPVLSPLSPKIDIQINDSLSISEFLAESHPELPLWPKDRELRALARSVVAEMHSGFGEIRNTYHSNFLAKYRGKIPITEQGRKEIERILVLWGGSRTKTMQRLKDLGEQDDGFLFGKFGIADAFFWPVLWRFRSYDLPLTNASPEALAWMKTMWSDPVIKLLIGYYFKQAEDPETTIEKYENIFGGNPDIQYTKFEQQWDFAAV